MERFVVKDKKLWLPLREGLTEEGFLELIDQLTDLIKRSSIKHFR